MKFKKPTVFQIKEKLYTPFGFATIAVTLSVSAFLAISTVIEIVDFRNMLIIATVIPILASVPMSIVFLANLKKIRNQKIQLEKLDSINKKIFSLLSHDIRSPLASVKGMVFLLANEALELEEGKLHLNQLSIKIDKVLNFLDDLLQWSKKQTENKSIEYSLFECKEVIQSSYELLEGARRAKHIQLEIGNLNNPIYTDKDIYAFVFRNIYQNAIKFTPKYGKIEINTEIKGGELYTIIKDSGVGIGKDDIKEILDESTWFTKKGTFDEMGTGFGLSSCINYLKENNGKLLIDSEGGNGTSMTIVLPTKLTSN